VLRVLTGMRSLLQDLSFTREVLVDERFSQIAVQGAKSHTTPGTIDSLLLGVSCVLAHKVTKFQIHGVRVSCPVTFFGRPQSEGQRYDT
jgi:hypothetical protein